MAELVVLGLGSNKDFSPSPSRNLSSEKILLCAVDELSKIFIPNTMNSSSIYTSRAMYYENQDDFLNMVVCGMYEGEPCELLDKIHRIEANFGRNRQNEIRNGPRTLDIDIELFGKRIINTENLVIPHKKITERQFVLLPLLEILPECAEPISGDLFKDILKKLPDQQVRLFNM